MNQPHGHPIAELVRTVLSQNTNDRNRDVAYNRLRERFPTWEQVRDAPTEEVEAAIKPGGLSVTKAPRIQEILGRLGDHPDLDWLAEAPREEALSYLDDLPGVGRKTAACVMIFAFGRPEIPVDTHVHRVGGRLGLFRQGAPFEEAHDEMLAITPPEDAYELHINLIQHGRAVCRPKPRCGECGLRRMCPYYKSNMLPRREMKRSTFVMFGLVVLILGIGVPAWAITHEGSQSASPEDVPASLQAGKDLFVTNCGACHTLAKAGTDGVIGPNLDELLAPPSASAPDPATIKPRVLSAINNGVAGRMPKGVLSGQQADEVATFVSQVAGQGP